MKPRIFIDGEHGTTGLQIRSRLAGRTDLDVISIPEAERRNKAMREDFLKQADIAILCLPDEGSREAVEMLAGTNSTRLIDTATAHRVDPDWVYGFAEMDKDQAAKIARARLAHIDDVVVADRAGLCRRRQDQGQGQGQGKGQEQDADSHRSTHFAAPTSLSDLRPAAAVTARTRCRICLFIEQRCQSNDSGVD